MKTKSHASPWSFIALLFAVLLVAFFYCVVTSPVMAQAALPGAGDPAAATTTTPWYADGAVIGAFIAAITSLFAVWAQKGKSRAQLINESLIIGIEAATKIPAVAEQEKRIKARIRDVAEDYGVQPVLARMVKDLT